jgi:sulfur carrier protein ThiS
LLFRDDPTGALEDGLGRPVVAFELDHPRVRVVVLEVENVADVGAAPGVDRLVRIAHHAEVAVLLRDLLDQLVLHAIRVLVLVDQDVLPAAPVVAEYLRKAFEELRGLHEQVVEVEGVGVDEQPLVRVVDLGGALAVDVGRAGRRLRGSHTGILPVVDPPPDPPRIARLGIQAMTLESVLHDSQSVGFVIDHETAGVAQVGDVAPQDSRAGRVEGRDPEISCGRAEELLHAFAHLARSLVGEGHGQDAVAGNATHADQVGDAVGEHPRLTASGSRQHEQRPLGRLDGLALFGVQAFQNHVGLHGELPPGDSGWFGTGREPAG